MRIAGLSATFPSRIVDNEEILSMISALSKKTYRGDLQRAVRRVGHYFRYSGLEYRRWLAPSEKPIELLSSAVVGALHNAMWAVDDIDLLIYTGVGGGFREPGNGYMVAHALGIDRAQCFDITDACNSWSRALQYVYHLFRGDTSYSRALIINAEFHTLAGGSGFPELWRLTEEAEIEWRFPAYTIGEAATATLLEREIARDWEFYFSSFPDHAALCTIPANKCWKDYCAIGLGSRDEKSRSQIGRNGDGLFTSFGTELFQLVGQEAPRIFSKLRCPREEIRMVFPHAVSKKLFEDAAKLVGSPPMYYVYPHYGNLVSASVPAGIYLAQKDTLIKRGDRLVGWVASAGMSFSAYSFIY